MHSPVAAAAAAANRIRVAIDPTGNLPEMLHAIAETEVVSLDVVLELDGGDLSQLNDDLNDLGLAITAAQLRNREDDEPHAPLVTSRQITFKVLNEVDRDDLAKLLEPWVGTRPVDLHATLSGLQDNVLDEMEAIADLCGCEAVYFDNNYWQLRASHEPTVRTVGVVTSSSESNCPGVSNAPPTSQPQLRHVSPSAPPLAPRRGVRGSSALAIKRSAWCVGWVGVWLAAYISSPVWGLYTGPRWAMQHYWKFPKHSVSSPRRFGWGDASVLAVRSVWAVTAVPYMLGAMLTSPFWGPYAAAVWTADRYAAWPR